MPNILRLLLENLIRNMHDESGKEFRPKLRGNKCKVFSKQRDAIEDFD